MHFIPCLKLYIKKDCRKKKASVGNIYAKLFAEEEIPYGKPIFIIVCRMTLVASFIAFSKSTSQ
jgi:hypothetical protein